MGVNAEMFIAVPAGSGRAALSRLEQAHAVAGERSPLHGPCKLRADGGVFHAEDDRSTAHDVAPGCDVINVGWCGRAHDFDWQVLLADWCEVAVSGCVVLRGTDAWGVPAPWPRSARYPCGHCGGRWNRYTPATRMLRCDCGAERFIEGDGDPWADLR
jgi:hypothetical protein